MSELNRRNFIALSAATAAFMGSARNLAALQPPKPGPYTLVAAIDHDRILREANHWLPEVPETITAYPSPRSPGGLHDFFSEADYFWPNPKNPNGPYINRDGQSNPANFQLHRQAMIRLSLAVPALTAAYLLTHRPAYAQAAARHLTAWFVTTSTCMNPNLQYAQGYHGGPTGRSYGIIDTLHLVEVARATSFLQEALGPNWAGVQTWFHDYLDWLKTSAPGIKERDAKNNHGICWALQAAEFARLIKDEATRDEVRTRWETIQLPDQMGPDGSFPRELARTKPYSYSIFNFDVAAGLCWSLSAPGSNGAESRFALPDGRGMCRAAAFLEPYLADKSQWPYKQDVEHWENLPVRSPGLLFCGLACDRKEYVAVWRRLNPDPTDPEIIRNYPIRQPLLWVA
ncbi:MAG TPA: alginate lyase family protein [Acidobacteriaceae bacterium]